MRVASPFCRPDHDLAKPAMQRRVFLSVLPALAMCHIQRAFGAQIAGVPIDPDALVRPPLLAEALSAWARWPQTQRTHLAIVDFSLPSNEPRFFVVDLRDGSVQACLTAHGRGSDQDHDGRAEHFSNAAGSLASSLGAYRTGARYIGQHGLSLRLEGLEPSNADAAARAIVLHGAEYMTPSYLRRHGRPGRSFGCFVVDPDLVPALIARLEGGVLLYAGA